MKNVKLISFSVFLAVLISFCLLPGCRRRVESDFLEKVTLPMEVKTRATKLRASVILDSYDFVRAKAFYVYRDSIMVIVNNPSNDCDFLELYNLNTHKLIKSFIKKGNGPGEMLSVSPFLSGDKLQLRDFVKSNLFTVNLEEAVTIEDYKIPLPVHYGGDIPSPFVTSYDAESLIELNPYCFQDEALRINNRESRFLICKMGEPAPVPEDVGSKYDAYNVAQGEILVNPDKNRILYPSLDFPRLELYDYNLAPLKCIEGPDKLLASYRIEDGRAICFNRTIPYSYLGSVTTEDFVYLSYIGDYYKDKVQDLKSYIFKFDWDGNWVESFDTGHYINKISISSDGTLYGCGYDDDGTLVLWRLDK